MKVAILTWNYLPNKAGGTEIATQNISRFLTYRKHEIIIVTSRDAELPGLSYEEDIRIFRIGFTGGRNFITKLFKYTSYCFKAAILIKRFKPDIIHAQALWTGLPALIGKIITGRPYVVWCQGSDIYFPRQFKGILAKLVLKNAGAVIALTYDMKKRIQTICDRDINIIGNGVDLVKFGRYSRKEARYQLGIREDEKVIIFVGSLTPVKGVQYLIEAMNIIRHSHPSVRLLLVGDGMERQILETLVSVMDLGQNITFFGRVKNDEVPKYIAASDVFVLPSLSEGFPLTVAEAMAAGLPVVSTQVRGLSEIIKEGENGFLVEPKNSSQLADKTLRILNNDSLHEEISVKNRAWANLNSWDKVVEKLETQYLKII